MTDYIETYKGSRIYRDIEDGYYAGSLGYCDTIEEMRADIDNDIAQDEEFYGVGGHDDTPCIDDTFHRIERDID